MGTPALNKTRTQQQREHGLLQHPRLHSKRWEVMHLAWFSILKSLEVGGNICLCFIKHHQYSAEERKSFVVQTTGEGRADELEAAVIRSPVLNQFSVADTNGITSSYQRKIKALSMQNQFNATVINSISKQHLHANTTETRLHGARWQQDAFTSQPLPPQLQQTPSMPELPTRLSTAQKQH